MTYEAFIKLVDSMRTAQKEYFKSRSAASLSKSKRLEREVDFEINKHKNPDLFS